MRKFSLRIKNLLWVSVFALLLACGNEENTSEAENTTDNAVPVESTSSQGEPASDNAEGAENTEAEANALTADLPEGPRADQGLAEITFNETSYDFGTVKDGDLVTYSYIFTNTGKIPLVIENATASCGCTVPEWPKEPIPPGEEGQIDVEFNSKNRPGRANKSVTITANTNPPKTFLQLSGTVTR